MSPPILSMRVSWQLTREFLGLTGGDKRTFSNR